MLAEDIKTVDDFVGDAFGKVSVVAAFGRIKTALAELGTAPNTGSPKLPTFEKAMVAIGKEAYCVSPAAIREQGAKDMYLFIERQLRNVSVGLSKMCGCFHLTRAGA